MYVPAVMKTYQFWLENRQRSLFPRTTITIPTAVLPAPIINQEDNLVATLRDWLMAVTNHRDMYRQQRDASRTSRASLTKEQDDLQAKLAAVTAERDQAIAAQRTRDPSSDRESQRHSQAISQL
jgi:hypothetical protein